MKGPPIEIRIPPLLSETELAALRVRLAETSTSMFGPGRRDPYLLSRRITSPHGTPMYGSWRKQRATAHYMCGHTQQASGWPRCDCHNTQVTALDDMVWRSITDRLLDDIVCDGAGASGAHLGDSPVLERRNADEVTGSGATIDRFEGVWRIATGVRDVVARGDQALRQRIVELLDVRVHVTGWHTCQTCVGKGWLPDPRALPKVKVRPQGEHMQALKCPTCDAYKHLPDIEVSGTLPALPAQASSVGRGTPFRIVLPPGEHLGTPAQQPTRSTDTGRPNPWMSWAQVQHVKQRMTPRVQ